MTPFLILGAAYLAAITLAIALCKAAAIADANLAHPDPESVEQYADRELRQFAAPHLDRVEIERLRAVARRQAEAVQR